ncbi:hypothetical protein ABH907_003702 [Pseudomonas frederiksbergensis]
MNRGEVFRREVFFSSRNVVQHEPLPFQIDSKETTVFEGGLCLVHHPAW